MMVAVSGDLICLIVYLTVTCMCVYMFSCICAILEACVFICFPAFVHFFKNAWKIIQIHFKLMFFYHLTHTLTHSHTDTHAPPHRQADRRTDTHTYIHTHKRIRFYPASYWLIVSFLFQSKIITFCLHKLIALNDTKCNYGQDQSLYNKMMVNEPLI